MLGIAAKLKPRSTEADYIIKTLRKWIDRYGPEEALARIENSKAHLVEQIDYLASL